MLRQYIAALLITVLFLFQVSCETVPLTGRRQLSLLPDQQLTAMGLNTYKEFLDSHEVITGTPEARMVEKVGQRISSAVETYLRQNNMNQKLADLKWEFNLVRDKSANAWVLPGGKVAVYSGIMPIARNETGLAVVMGHEIAHMVAGHGNERMSQALLTQMGGIALQTALSEQPALTQNLLMTAFGLGAQIGVLLPYSRLHEAEADHLGLIFMAMAGYDPREAVVFWQRMAQKAEGPSPPALLSTHPSDSERIKKIREHMSEALSYYH
jgi:predicted Zn-dependent protease